MGIVFNEDKTKAQIKNVVLAYVKLQEGDWKYQSTTEKQYSVDCIVDKATAKVYKKAFPKNGVKEIDTEDFESKYKFAPPFSDKDEQYIISLKANTGMKVDFPKANLVVGDLVPYEWASRPKVYVPIDGGVKDITMTTLVANGSVGDVAFKINSNTFGTFPQLSGMLVTQLIEYEAADGPGMSEFGNVVGGYNPPKGGMQQIATVSHDVQDGGVVADEEPDISEFDKDTIPF